MIFVNLVIRPPDRGSAFWNLDFSLRGFDTISRQNPPRKNRNFGLDESSAGDYDSEVRFFLFAAAVLLAAPAGSSVDVAELARGPGMTFFSAPLNSFFDLDAKQTRLVLDARWTRAMDRAFWTLSARFVREREAANAASKKT